MNIVKKVGIKIIFVLLFASRHNFYCVNKIYFVLKGLNYFSYLTVYERTCKFSFGLRLHLPVTTMIVELLKSCLPLPLLLNELVTAPTPLLASDLMNINQISKLLAID